MKDGDATRELETSECEKDLGVNIDPLLDFNKHITNGYTQCIIHCPQICRSRDTYTFFFQILQLYYLDFVLREAKVYRGLMFREYVLI